MGLKGPTHKEKEEGSTIRKKKKGSNLHITQFQLATEGVDVSFQSVIFL